MFPDEFRDSMKLYRELDLISKGNVTRGQSGKVYSKKRGYKQFKKRKAANR